MAAAARLPHILFRSSGGAVLHYPSPSLIALSAVSISTYFDNGVLYGLLVAINNWTEDVKENP